MSEDTWIMKGLEWDNPYRIRSYKELINWINEVGFLPLFRNSITGFSVEEHVSPLFWWTGDVKEDPWEWREIIARSHEVAYGKFFDKRAGFISLKWLPVFANYRRDGYDFDSRWEDGLANRREKDVMNLLTGRDADGEMIFPEIRISKEYMYLMEAGKGKLSQQIAQKIEKTCDHAGAEWLLTGEERNRVYPVGEDMIEWLRDHPEKRKVIWEWMAHGGDKGGAL